MAEKKFFVDVDLQGNTINNLKTDILDITTNLASENAKRIVFYNNQYYYSNGTTWINMIGGGSAQNGIPIGGNEGQILAKNSNTDYDALWIDNYTSSVKHQVKAGVAVTKGQAVYITSANGTNMIVGKASNGSEATSSKTLGLIDSTLAINDFGYVVTEGLLSGLNTGSATVGDAVWLGTNGNLLFGISNKPVAPAHLVYIGVVTRVSSTVGEIFINIQNGFEISEIHDVSLNSLSNNHGLFYNSSNNLWENKSIENALGFTPSEKNISLNRKIESYIAVSSDNGKLIEMNVASANTFTINSSLFSSGNKIMISQYGVGQTTIVAGENMIVRSNGNKLKTSGQYALVTIIFISNTEFYVTGDLTS